MESIIILILVCLCVLSLLTVRAFRFTKNKCVKSGYIIVPCSSGTKNLEKTVKAYFWEEVFEGENLGREILIVTLEKSENDYIAKKLSAQLPIVSVVDITAVEDYIKRREFFCGRTKDV